MKYSFMSFSCPELSLQDMLNTAEKYGYDGVEPRIDSGHAHGIERATDAQTRASLKSEAQKSKVALCCLATSCKYADPTNVEEQVAITLESIDLAADLGVPAIRVFGGKIPEVVDREKATALLTDAMKTVANRAQERNVTVCMETHDDWCDPNHLAEVMRRVAHPSIAINWDIMHPVRTAGFSIEDSFKILKPWIRHVHFHDGTQRDSKLQLTPIGEGDIDHKAAVKLRTEMQYDGFLSGEWIRWQPYDIHLPREIQAVKSCETTS